MTTIKPSIHFGSQISKQKLRDIELFRLWRHPLFLESSTKSINTLKKDILRWRRTITGKISEYPLVTVLTNNALDDKLSLVLVPLLASAGLRVLKPIWNDKFSGQALYKNLLSIPGINLPSNPEDSDKILLRTKGAFALFPESPFLHDAHSTASDPFDIDGFRKKCLFTLYAVDWDGIAFDIRIGDHASTMPINIAQKLSQEIREHCDAEHIGSSCFISHMVQPLGNALGPYLELQEARDVLTAQGPLDLMKLAIELGSDLLMHVQKFTDRTLAKSFLKGQLQKGAAKDRFKRIIQTMNGDLGSKDGHSPSLSVKRLRVLSSRNGYVQRIDMNRLLDIKHSLCQEHRDIGLCLLKKIGDTTAKGDILLEAIIPSYKDTRIFHHKLQDIFSISHSPPEFRPLIVEKIKGSFRF